jgi:hypothetical protein
MAQDTRKKHSQRTGTADRQPAPRPKERQPSPGGTPPEKLELSQDQATHGPEDKHGEKRNTM